MNFTEKEIIVRAKKILTDLNGISFDTKKIENAWFDKDRKVRDSMDLTKPSWIVSINEPIFDNTVFLTISDETGEPLYIQNKHAVAEIKKDTDGKYII
jgi:hypothetical protein